MQAGAAIALTLAKEMNSIYKSVIALFVMFTSAAFSEDEINAEQLFWNMVDTSESIAIIDQGKVDRVLRGNDMQAEKFINAIGQNRMNRIPKIVFLYSDPKGRKRIVAYGIINELIHPPSVGVNNKPPGVAIEKLIERIKAKK